MGQYYHICNLNKQQYLHPHKFGDGLKMLEFGSSGCGTMTALAILLADGNGLGGGDLRSNNEIVGSWAGDRIVVAGDYAEANRWGLEGKKDGDGNDLTLYAACENWEDISDKVIEAMSDDSYLCQVLAERAGRGSPGKENAPGLYAARERASREGLVERSPASVTEKNKI